MLRKMSLEEKLPKNSIILGDTFSILKTLPAESVNCIITSPPYWGLRDYGVAGQLGLEHSIEEFLQNMLAITAECKRVLKKEGTLFWNHGDNYGTGSGAGVRIGKQATNRGTQTNVGWQKNGKAAVVGYEKSLMMQPYRLAIRMTDEQGWILRNMVIWHKPNAMPNSIKDRFGVDFEPIFFFTKNKKYYFKQQLEKALSSDTKINTELPQGFNMRVRDVARGKVASAQYKASKDELTSTDRYGRRKMKDPRHGGSGKGLHGHSGNYRPDGTYIGTPGMRGKRTVWNIPTKSFSDAHFATFPEELIEPMVLAGCPRGGVILDPFMGAGTTAVVSQKLGRNWVEIELNPKYVEIANKRIAGTPVPLPDI